MIAILIMPSEHVLPSQSRLVALQELRCFLLVAELQSFTLAAATAGVTQPAISRSVQALEQLWGGRLFHRTVRGASLTEFGQIALPRARALLREAEQISEDLRSHSAVPSGTVAVAYPPSVASLLIPALVSRLQRGFPGIRLKLHEAFTLQIEKWLASGEVDIAILSKHREAVGGTRTDLFNSEMYLATPNITCGLPPETRFRDLKDLPLVLPALPNRMRAYFEGTAARLGITFNVIAETDSVPTQYSICRECNAYMLIAPPFIRSDPTMGRYATSLITDPSIERYGQLITTTQRPASRATLTVVDCIQLLIEMVSK